MPARMQTIDWLNAELDKTEAALAEARRQLAKMRIELLFAGRELLSYDKSYGGGGGESSAFGIAKLLGYEDAMTYEAIDEWLASQAGSEAEVKP